MVKSSTIPKTQAPLWLIWVTNRLLLTLPLQIPFRVQAGYQLPLSVVFPDFRLLRLVCVVHPPSLLQVLIDLPPMDFPLCVWSRKKMKADKYPLKISYEMLLLTMEIRYENSVNSSLQVFQNNCFLSFFAYKYEGFNWNSHISYYYEFSSNNWVFLFFFELFSWSPSLKQVPGFNGMDKGKDDIFPYNTNLKTKQKMGLAPCMETNSTPITGPPEAVDVTNQNKDSNEDPIQTKSVVTNIEDGISAKELEIVQNIDEQPKDVLAAQITQGNYVDDYQNTNLQEELEDYEEEQFEYEYDDLLVDEPKEFDNPTLPLLTITEAVMKPIPISDDPPFSEKDLEDFINNEQMGIKANPARSEGSFHSMQYLIHSSSSFAVELGKLAMNHAENSTSTSSKRRGVRWHRRYGFI